MTTAGTGIGAFYGGRFIKGGRRKAAIQMSIVSILSVIPTLIQNYPTIVIFKFIWGCTCGTFGVITARMIEEIFPVHLTSIGGCMTNTSYGFGAMISIVLGLFLPPDSDKKALASTEAWRIIFGFPMLLSALVLISFLLFFKYDSPKFYLSVGDEDSARKAISLLYDTSINSEDKIL